VLGGKSDQVGGAAGWHGMHRTGPGCWQSAVEPKCCNCTARPQRSCQKSSRTRMQCVFFHFYANLCHSSNLLLDDPVGLCVNLCAISVLFCANVKS